VPRTASLATDCNWPGRLRGLEQRVRRLAGAERAAGGSGGAAGVHPSLPFDCWDWAESSQPV